MTVTSTGRSRARGTAASSLLGFGGANLASGLFGGFPVTASDLRTAINDAMGGKTQLAGIVSAAALALTVVFLADAISVLPTPALGAVLASAAVSSLTCALCTTCGG